MKHLLFIWILPLLMNAQSNNTSLIKGSPKGSLSNLQHLVRAPKDTTKPAPVLILLHGYGSNEKDLFSLSSKIPEHWLVVSVRAPIALAPTQFKWYNVKLVQGEITMNFEDQEKSRKLLLKLIDQIVLKYKTDKSRIVTAGFSQGANMALGLALTEPDKVLAAGCFSGRFMEEIKPLIQNKKALQSKQVFIAHGSEDQLLPIKYAEDNKVLLQGMGLEVTFCKDKIGHSISNKELTAFVAWLKLRE